MQQPAIARGGLIGAFASAFLSALVAVPNHMVSRYEAMCQAAEDYFR